MTSDGAFSIRSASGTTIARLGEGNAGGLFQLANSGGNAMVDAGVLPSGAGAVRAYPLGSPSAGLLGCPARSSWVTQVTRERAAPADLATSRRGPYPRP